MKSLLLLLLVVFASCQRTPDRGSQGKDMVVNGSNIRIGTVDGCQYFWFVYDRSKSLTHKGNCNNPIHDYKENEWPFHNGHAKKLNDSTMVYRWYWYDTVNFGVFINDSIFLLDLEKTNQ